LKTFPDNTASEKTLNGCKQICPQKQRTARTSHKKRWVPPPKPAALSSVSSAAGSVALLKTSKMLRNRRSNMNVKELLITLCCQSHTHIRSKRKAKGKGKGKKHVPVLSVHRLVDISRFSHTDRVVRKVAFILQGPLVRLCTEIGVFQLFRHHLIQCDV